MECECTQVHAHTFSVTRQKPPEFARSSKSQRSRPIQVRRNRAPQVRKERLCYNCRKEGHLAKDCNRPNPRSQHLTVPPLKLSEQLKRKIYHFPLWIQPCVTPPLDKPISPEECLAIR